MVLLLILGIITISGCKKNDGINIPLENEINEFIWEGMRTYYYWVSEVPDLADGRFTTFDELHTFLNEYSTPESLFADFKVEKDRFSFLVDDYNKLDNALQGISNSFGYEFRLVKIGESKRIFGYVQYVISESPAENVGLKRGDLFDAVDGIDLTEDNFEELLFGRDSYTLSMGEFVSREEGLERNGTSISISAVELTENPVYLTKTFDLNGVKAGYLVYNQFVRTRHSELNEAIGLLKSEGVSELILDLRYNPGGSIATAQALGSMLYSNGTSDVVFGEYFFNDLLTSAFSANGNDPNFYFLDELPIYDGMNNSPVGSEEINRLNLSRIFILTSSGTASASELLLVGLRPYLPVTVIGTTTVGKNVGSVTLYDSSVKRYTEKKDLNPNHKYAIQPIISQLANSVGFTEYNNGIEPDVEISELDFLGEIEPLGSESEPLLQEALSIISGTGRISNRISLNMERVYDSKEYRPFLYRSLLDPIKIDPDTTLK